MTLFVILFHVIACITLILVVLLQAGSESGLSGGLGGGASDSVLGAKSNTFLTKFTTVMAVVFMCSSLSLAVVAAKGGKSVMVGKDPEASIVNQLKKQVNKAKEKIIDKAVGETVNSEQLKVNSGDENGSQKTIGETDKKVSEKTDAKKVIE